MKTFTLLLALFCLHFTVLAQKASIRGVLKDEKQTVLPFANVLLLNSVDSSLVKGETSTEDGSFLFTAVSNGTYFLRVSVLGMSPLALEIRIDSLHQEIDLGTLTLKEDAQQLGEIVVVTEKPFIEREADKTIVNVENSIIQKGASVMEVMEKLPGVIVDQDGRIMMRGKQGVIIMMDGKPMVLAGQDLVNYLRSMPAANIEKIEIITNPSAKYDASGNAGILNIVSKKNKLEGYSGGLTLGYGQGRYAKYNVAVNFNYRRNKWNLYFNYAYNKRKGFNQLDLHREFFSGDSLLQSFDNSNYLTFPAQLHAPRFGVDYTISKKSSISLLVSGISNPFSTSTASESIVKNGSGNTMGNYFFNSETEEAFLDHEISLRLDHKPDTSGSLWTFIFDYGKYTSDADQNLSTLYRNVSPIQYTQTDLYSKQKGSLSLLSGRADFSKPLKNGKAIETGWKSTYVHSDQDMQFYQVLAGEKEFDTTRSSHFLYSENINALYFTFKKQYEKWMLQFGLRAEQTLAKGEQLLNNVTFNRSYIQVFPTAYLDYTPNDKHNLNLNFGRRIDRPNYHSMNPMRQWIDATTYGEGNPFLLPQITYLAELNYAWKNKVFVSMAYNFSVDNILEVLIQDPVTQTTNQTVINLDNNHYLSASLTYSDRITKWWRTNTTFMTYYSRFIGDVGSFSIDNGQPSIYFSSNHSFRLSDRFSAELGFNYMHKNLYGVTTMYTTHNLTLGIQMALMKNKASLTLNCSDVFWKAWPRGFTEFSTVTESWGAKRDTRVLNVSFSYKFAKGQTGRMRRESGADDVKGRIGK